MLIDSLPPRQAPVTEVLALPPLQGFRGPLKSLIGRRLKRLPSAQKEMTPLPPD
ncbi:MAG: hypothetical protein N3E46_11430 [Gemmataceae bacterium]|nr:hypothetical protein [Gemmataceae bacterium]